MRVNKSPSFSAGWGFVLVYRLDLPASVGWRCGPQLLATTSQEFPIGTVTVSLTPPNPGEEYF